MARTLAIGDIHGCHIALETLLDRLQPTAEDTIVQLGDAVDRGPATRDVLDRLIELNHLCRLIFLCGNHEEMMLLARLGSSWLADWLAFGGQEVLESYGTARLEEIPQAHWDFLAGALPYWQTETDIFVHANLEPGVPLDEQSPEALRWAKYTGLEPPLPSGKRVICGHTAQKSGLPAGHDNWLCIDTWVYGDGWLTCLDVQNNVVYQARQTGEFRGGLPLSDL